ncbi:threonine-phosphate decarboxylase CobD [Ahrensia sp. R2A130]|uniref:threonine-phosphate decarboxylase CobD n=1 Tax=Ahrensia sp. R2A130 TaxID=744979 RepID=UPI0001E0AC5D|nr:threonine-phosphate decarboxylase CobD [Ahrensia sp. R2A130]EFL90674.1 threonine-phosphate decarboxylase [Ahrensia sp. R2A130]
MKALEHGGRLDAAIAKHGGTAKQWLDLSTGINPRGYLVGEVHPDAWARLPDTARWTAAVEAQRHSCEAPQQAGISLAPGTQMHIQQLPTLFKPQPVAIVGFTYQEHAHCWKRAGHNVLITDGLESAKATARIIIVVNPNNPDGRQYDPDELAALGRSLGSKGGLLVVDESFGDVAPDLSVAPQTGFDGLVVLRSLGKFYGLAGVRFGAAIGAPALTDKLDETLGPWSVSGPALDLAARALSDRTWRTRMRRKLKADRDDLEATLKERSFRLLGGTNLFVLVETSQSKALAEHLAGHRILVRQFSAKPDWVRFGLPGSLPALKRLAKALDGAPGSVAV